MCKETSRAEVDCYRPISPIQNVSKVSKKVIFNKIFSHCRLRRHENQFGFRKTRSSTTQHLLFLDTVYRKIDKISSNSICILYLDFVKAFDQVPHHFLLKKLESIEVGGNILSCMHSYLEDRKQFVKNRNFGSSFENVTNGVPQGSILRTNTS